MRLVRQVAALARRLRRDQQPAVLFLDAVARDLVGLVAGLALAGATMEPVLVPGTHDELTFEPALAQRTADVVADIRDDAELAVLE